MTKTFTVEMSEDNLPAELIYTIQRKAIRRSVIGLWRDATIYIFDESMSYGSIDPFSIENNPLPHFNILDLITECEDDPVLAQKLIPIFEQALVKLREIGQDGNAV